MAASDYDIKEVDLSTGPQTNARLDFAFPVREITVLTRGGLAYVKPEASAPGIPIRSVGQTIKLSEPTRAVFFDFSRGSGVLELMVSGGGTCVGFSGASSGAAAIDRETVLAHFNPRGYNTPQVTTLSDQVSNDALTFTASGTGAVATIAHDSTLGLHGLRVRGPAGGGGNAGGRVSFDRLSPALFTLLNSGTASKRFPRSFYLSFSDLIYASKAYSSGTLFGEFGFGFANLFNGIEGQSVAFGFYGSSTTWEAVVRDQATGYLYRHALTGYPLDAMYQLELRIGAAAGSPFVQWWIDDVQAHELNLPLTTPMVRSAAQFSPFWGAMRTNAADEVDMWGLLGGGAYVKHVLPAAA